MYLTNIACIPNILDKLLVNNLQAKNYLLAKRMNHFK